MHTFYYVYNVATCKGFVYVFSITITYGAITYGAITSDIYFTYLTYLTVYLTYLFNLIYFFYLSYLSYLSYNIVYSFGLHTYVKLLINVFIGTTL